VKIVLAFLVFFPWIGPPAEVLEQLEALSVLWDRSWRGGVPAEEDLGEEEDWLASRSSRRESFSPLEFALSRLVLLFSIPFTFEKLPLEKLPFGKFPFIIWANMALAATGFPRRGLLSGFVDGDSRRSWILKDPAVEEEFVEVGFFGGCEVIKAPGFPCC